MYKTSKNIKRYFPKERHPHEGRKWLAKEPQHLIKLVKNEDLPTPKLKAL
jgi:hypothetical protein